MAEQSSRVPVYVVISLLLTFYAFAQTDPYSQAVELFRQHQWAAAVTAFERYEKAAPGKSDAPLYIAKSKINLGQVHEADSVLENYIQQNPQSDDALSLLAYLRFREDKPKESLQLFTAAAKLKTPSADDFKIVALDYVLLGDYEDAARYLEQCLKMDPGNLEARYHLGRVRYQQNKFDDAIAAFQEVVRRDPGNVKAQENLGLSLEGKNQTDAAISAYRKAIELDQSASAHSEQPYLDLGILLGKLNRGAEAIPLLTRAAAIAPKLVKAHYELGKAYFGQNELDEARMQIEEAVKLDASDSSSHYLLGRIYQRMGKHELAAQQFALTNDLIGKHNANATSGMAGGDR